MTAIEHLPAVSGSPIERVFPDAEPRTNLLELPAGERVPEHRHPDRTVVFYVLDGEIELRVGDDSYALGKGDIARFSGDQKISPAAIADSRALVILSPTGGET
ncbi:cupin domain-containing protein [Natrarchaeobius sp. A-rgal3]|uniref:cupin domain-containing protein n=1 Tax=Natrarchaeobius versutus TaxID=1679078 RepID=UPI003510CB52